MLFRSVNITFGGSGTNTLVARHEEMDATRAPLGAVVAWLKSFPETPLALPAGWVECNGQVLDNTNSVYHGKTIPNLNGSAGQTKRFLRGSSTSGSSGGAETHSHSLAAGGTINSDAGVYRPYAAGTTSADSLPSYYSVVWIMRVK